MAEHFVTRKNCELCGGDQKRILLSLEFTDPLLWSFLAQYYEGRIDKSDVAGGKYEVVRCLQCGFIWQAQILNDTLMEKLYSFWVVPERSLEKKRCADISLYSNYANEVKVIASLLGKKPFEINVLDFGMGWGYWCFMAKAFGYNVTAFEMSKERSEFARRNGINVLDKFSETSLQQFDFINAEQVFEHLSAPSKILHRLSSSLRKGGVIRISVPNGESIEKELANPNWKPSKNAVHPLEHVNCFTSATLIRLADGSGLKIMAQPRLNRSFKSYLRHFMGKYFNRYYGACLYFRKESGG